jgi:hypothetical protein
MRVIPKLRLECNHCKHIAEVAGVLFEQRLGEPLTMTSVGLLSGKTRCSKCNSLEILIFEDTGRLLIDPAELTLCESCGCAIPIPRLHAMPGSNICVSCSDQKTETQPAPPHPQPPPDRRTCPRCKRPTAVRQNAADKNFFLGCTGYPSCHWTSPI